MQGPIEIAEDVFWVGHTREGDPFQCHAYLIRAGRDSVLIDPGSIMSIEHTMAKVRQLMDPEDIGWIVCHHPDPDVASALTQLSTLLQRPDTRLVTEWRGNALLDHYGHRFEPYQVEQHEWRLALGDERSLEFQISPYLHFPGAFVTFDVTSRTLFSSDIFGGFVEEPYPLLCNDPAAVIEAVTPFHQHYMPSGALLRASLQRMQQRWPNIARVAPQHGYVFEGDAVEPTFAALQKLECGLFIQESGDHDLERFLRVAEARAELQRLMMDTADVAAWLGALYGVIARTGLAEGCELEVLIPNAGWHRWGWNVEGEAIDHTVGPETVGLPGEPAAALRLLGVSSPDAIQQLHALVLDFSDVLRPLVDGLVQEYEHTETVERLRRASETDALTGCPNRRALTKRPPSGRYGLLAIDIDNFKEVNDTLGHLAGDAAIVSVAQALRDCLRQSDVVYRIGGDEFVVVLPRADTARTLEIAERCRSVVASRQAGHEGARVTISIGAVSVSKGAPLPLRDAIAAADGALYEAKRAGRDRVCLAVDDVPARESQATN